MTALAEPKQLKRHFNEDDQDDNSFCHSVTFGVGVVSKDTTHYEDDIDPVLTGKQIDSIKFKSVSISYTPLFLIQGQVLTLKPPFISFLW